MHANNIANTYNPTRPERANMNYIKNNKWPPGAPMGPPTLDRLSYPYGHREQVAQATQSHLQNCTAFGPVLIKLIYTAAAAAIFGATVAR